MYKKLDEEKKKETNRNIYLFIMKMMEKKSVN